MAGGPPFFLAGAAHVEDVPEIKGQRLVGCGQVRRTAVVVEQGSADKKRGETKKSISLTFR